MDADREKILDDIEQYLLNKKVTLWQSWDIHNEERRRQAAEFILDLVDDVMDKVLIP